MQLTPSLLSQLEAYQANLLRDTEQSVQRRWGPQASRRTGERNGLINAIRNRLPKTAENAMPMAGVRALLEGIDYAESGLSAALSWLSATKEIRRVGSSGHYRYYRPAK